MFFKDEVWVINIFVCGENIVDLWEGVLFIWNVVVRNFVLVNGILFYKLNIGVNFVIFFNNFLYVNLEYIDMKIWMILRVIGLEFRISCVFYKLILKVLVLWICFDEDYLKMYNLNVVCFGEVLRYFLNNYFKYDMSYLLLLIDVVKRVERLVIIRILLLRCLFLNICFFGIEDVLLFNKIGWLVGKEFIVGFNRIFFDYNFKFLVSEGRSKVEGVL